MELRGRTSSIQLLEKVLIGSSLLDETSTDAEVQGFINNVVDLDTDWFNFMPDAFFVSKFHEEMGEFKDALLSYYVNKKVHSEHIANSMRYSAVSELSDAILAASSAIYEKKMDQDVVVQTLKDLVQYTLELDSRFGEEPFFSTVSARDIFIAHSHKVKEMVDAKDVYRDCVYGKETDWLALLLKLYTKEELMEPVNKMKIVKEIRRMSFFRDNFSK